MSNPHSGHPESGGGQIHHLGVNVWVSSLLSDPVMLIQLCWGSVDAPAALTSLTSLSHSKTGLSPSAAH